MNELPSPSALRSESPQGECPASEATVSAFRVEFRSVSKSFHDPRRGTVRAVDDIELSLGDGIVALLGANGAGKSTLLRLLAGLLVPDIGQVLVCGHETTRFGDAVRRQLGYLSLSTGCYPRLTGREMLAYAAGFYAMAPLQARQREEELIAAFGLQDYIDQRCGSLSTGQAQRINLARILLPDPDVLVLDEPTTGLDLLAARRMVDAVQTMRRTGRLVIFCTHLLHEADELADRILILRHGRLIHDGPADDLGHGDAFARTVAGLVAEEGR